MKSIKKTATVNDVASLLLNADKIAFFAHTNPDGDTVGATSALRMGMLQLGKHADIYCDCAIDAKILQLTGNPPVNKTIDGNYDLFVAVDCGDIFRLGEFAKLYGAHKRTLTIDHHGGEYYSDFNCVIEYASTCQIVYEILLAANVNITADIATALYVGLCTDTANFLNANSDSYSFDIASKLCALGANNTEVAQRLFKDTSLAKTKLLARTLSRMRTYYDDRLVILYVTQSDFAEFGLTINDTSFIVPYAINIDTAKVGVCISEYARDVYKVSMRGKNFSVREICAYFGGGGHKLAAGCMINGMLEEVIDKIVRVVGFQL